MRLAHTHQSEWNRTFSFAGEVDTRFSFCSLATLALLVSAPSWLVSSSQMLAHVLSLPHAHTHTHTHIQGRLDAVDVEKAVNFILSCMNFDGGFGRIPGSESHAGQVAPISSSLLHSLQLADYTSLHTPTHSNPHQRQPTHTTPTHIHIYQPPLHQPTISTIFTNPGLLLCRSTGHCRCTAPRGY